LLQGLGDCVSQSVCLQKLHGVAKVNKLALELFAQDYQTVQEGCVQFYYSGKEWGFDLATGLRIFSKCVASDLE